MVIGTDSLSSNWQLSIWEEIKTIKKYKEEDGSEKPLMQLYKNQEDRDFVVSFNGKVSFFMKSK